MYHLVPDGVLPKRPILCINQYRLRTTTNRTSSTPRHFANGWLILFFSSSATKATTNIDNTSCLSTTSLLSKKTMILPPFTYVIPCDIDVKCGRGANRFRHYGNKILRAKVALALEEYRTCPTRREKSRIIHRILDSCLSEGCRFLKYDPSANMWYNGGIKVARERIGIAFRDALQPNKVKCMDTMKTMIKDNDLSELPLSMSMALLSQCNTSSCHSCDSPPLRSTTPPVQISYLSMLNHKTETSNLFDLILSASQVTGSNKMQRNTADAVDPTNHFFDHQDYQRNDLDFGTDDYRIGLIEAYDILETLESDQEEDYDCAGTEWLENVFEAE